MVFGFPGAVGGGLGRREALGLSGVKAAAVMPSVVDLAAGARPLGSRAMLFSSQPDRGLPFETFL